MKKLTTFPKYMAVSQEASGPHGQTERRLDDMTRLFNLFRLVAKDAAHDGNNALTCIIGNLQLLRDNGTCPPSEVETMLSAAKILAGTIALLQGISKHPDGLDAGEGVPLDERSFENLFAHIPRVAKLEAGCYECRFIETYGAIEVHGITLLLADPPPRAAIAPFILMHVVVKQILLNAMKYCPGGGEILIKVNVPEVPTHLTISIRNNGVGITSELVSKVFDGGRLDAYSRGFPNGNGQSMKIVRSLMELWGGRVTAFSEGRGKGSTFVVTAPLLVDSLHH